MKMIPTTLACLAAAMFTASATAHIFLRSPNGGEELPSGGSFAIEWEIGQSHTTLR